MVFLQITKYKWIKVYATFCLKFTNNFNTIHLSKYKWFLIGSCLNKRFIYFYFYLKKKTSYQNIFYILMNPRFNNSIILI